MLRQKAWSRLGARQFGALTNKPYAFTARPWELRRIDSVDTTDGLGASISVHARGGEVMRIMPRENDEINEEWIHDKTRFSYDGLKRQRLTQPLVREGDKWCPTSSWRSALGTVAKALNKNPKTRAIVGPTADLYTTTALTDMMIRRGVSVESLASRGSSVAADLAAMYRFNSGVRGLESADFCLLVGTNLDKESPLLLTRLRKGFLRDTMEVVNLGANADLHFPVVHAGLTARTLVEIAEGRHPVSAQLASAKRPAIIVGEQVLEREDGATLAGAIETIAELSGNMRQCDAEGNLVWNGVNVLHHNANDCGHLDLGRTVPFKGAEPSELLYFVGVSAKDLPMPLDEFIPDDAFVVVQGSHGDELASRADVILPGAVSTEQPGLFVNVEGRPQKARNANTPPADARSDWKILRALSEVCGAALPYDCEADLQARVVELVPSVAHRNKVPAVSPPSAAASRLARDVLAKGYVNCSPFRPQIYDFYLDGNVVARSSSVMAECSRELNETSNFAQGEN